jgi:hypothetical protein
MRTMSEETPPTVQSLPPLIVDLGKISRKKAKQLKKGKGLYLEEVLPAVERIKASLGKTNGDGALPTVVVLYEKKRPKTKGLFRI